MWSFFPVVFIAWAVALIVYLVSYGYRRRGFGGLFRWFLGGMAWTVISAVLLTVAVWPPFNYLSVAAIVLLLGGLVWLLGRPAEERLKVVLIRADGETTVEEGENAGANSSRSLRG